MTRKEALATLDRGLQEVFALSLHRDPERDAERWKLYEEMSRAVNVLTPLVHGKAPDECFAMLCVQCHMQYVSWYTGDTYHHDWLCLSCRQAKQAALVAPTSEVTA